MFYVYLISATPTIVRFTHQSANFEQSMLAVGFSILRYDELVVENETYESSLSWVNHTLRWWNIIQQQGICPRTLKNLIKITHSPSYMNFGRFYMQQKYRQAGEELSEYPHGIEPKPAVAVIANAMINLDGEVYNETYFFEGKCGTCKPSRQQFFFSSSPQTYRKVITIAGFWGQGYFHFMHENFIRLPLVFSILDQDPVMKVHSHQGKTFMSELLAMFQIKQDRIVSGLVRADLAFVPEQIACGRPPANLLLLMQKSILQRNSVLFQNRLTRSKRQILIVKRKGTREIRNHDEIVTKFRKSFKGYNVLVHTGHESVENQLILFRSSDVIIAPHGAGLSNIVVCRQHTLIFELLTDKPMPNLCYTGIALKLKLLYVGHTIPHFDHSKTITVNSDSLITVLKQLMWFKMKFDDYS